MLRYVPLVVIFAGCNAICEQEPTPGVVATSGTASGTITVGQQTATFETGAETSFAGELFDDGTGATRLTVSEGAVFLEADVPDLRTNTAPRTIEVDGSIVVDGGYCNFTGEATLTVTHAAGTGAPEPQFVTSDFARTAELTLDPTAGCATSLAAHATLELTAASYAPVEHAENCPDLSR